MTEQDTATASVVGVTPPAQDYLDQEKLADDIHAAWLEEGGDPTATAALVRQFVEDASQHRDAEPLDWLQTQFRQHAELWPDDAALVQDAREIVETVQQQERLNASLAGFKQQGKSRNNWLGKELQQSAHRHGALSVGDYGRTIDQALIKANVLMRTTIMRNDGQISQALNLDGFIAETHHVNTFNVNAVASGSGARAELVIRPGKAFGKNSVDIQIKDASGRVVRRYQAKYGADANSTEKLFEKGDYRGQGSLVPEGHSSEMQRNAIETIDYDGVHSAPLSKEEAKRLRDAAQKEQLIEELDWRQADALTVGKRIGQTAVIAAGMGVCFQGGRILARRIWNNLTGKDNASVADDVQEFVEDSLSTVGSTLLTVSTSGALMVAAKRGLLGGVMKNTPAGRIAMLGTVIAGNMKTLYELARGRISKEEALDKVADTSITTLAGLAGGSGGASLGASIGTVFGPIGTLVGGLAGGIVGGMLGSTIGSQVYQASKTLAESAWSTVKSTTSAIGRGIANTARSVCGLLSSWL